MTRQKKEHQEVSGAVEVICPKCQRTEIVYVPREEIPKCEDCKKQMVIREILAEGKSY